MKHDETRRLFEETSPAFTRIFPCWRLLEHLLCFHVQVYYTVYQLVLLISVDSVVIHDDYLENDIWYIYIIIYIYIYCNITMIVLVVIMHDYHEHDCNEYWSLMVFVAAAYRWCRSHFEFLYHARISYDDWLQSKLLLVNILYLIIFDFSRPIFSSKTKLFAQIRQSPTTYSVTSIEPFNGHIALQRSPRWCHWSGRPGLERSWKVLKGLGHSRTIRHCP